LHRRRYFPALVALAALIIIPVGPARAAATASESTMAREIAQDINQERAARGLAAIPFDAGAYSAGAQRVAERNRDQPCHACHSSDHPSGEVVWWGSDYGSSGSTIWWMGSPSHRSLLLARNATKLGVGVACNGSAHDAVAWIETSSGDNSASANPVVTKSGTGSRCSGRSSTPVANPQSPAMTTATTARRAVAATTTTAAARRTTTTRAPVRRTTTTAASRRRIFAATAPSPPPARGGESPLQAGSMSSRSETALAFQPAVGSRPVVAATGFGATGTIVLLGVFGGVLVLGRATHRRQRPTPR
jgi:hypothetical protein